MIRRAQPWLGTMVEISVDGIADHAMLTAAFQAVARVHHLMGFHDPDSDVSRVNRAAPGEQVQLDADTWQVLALARDVAALSAGAFDIACAPRLVEWDILPAPARERPPVRALDEMLALEDDCRVRKLAPGWIDLGGIAKGYAVDRAVDALLAAGATGGCVNAGGDLRVFGPAAYPVALRAPHAPATAAAHLMLSGEALATSGSYFSSRSHRGRQVSALVDARDATPLVQACSASVRAPRCVLADALTKVVLATGDTHHPALAALGASAFVL
jgi:thiamine biosynthesis lipoprotein